MRKLDLTICLIINVIFFMTISSCQRKVYEHKVHESVMIERASMFPSDWCGDWNGNLKIYNGSGLVQTLPMGLDIAPTEDSLRYRWTISYGQDTLKDEREYELLVIDANLGKYIIDEKNSILIESFLVGDRLTSVFEVMGNVIHSVYSKNRDVLEFEIYVHKSKAISTTGDQVYEGDSIPAVTSYPVSGFQQATLYRNRVK